MLSKSKAIAPILLILIVTLGLTAGVAVGYQFREPLKKAIEGKTTSEEVQEAIDAVKSGQNKFELEGVISSVDVSLKTITVKIKSSTDSIKELRLSETPISVPDSVKITFGDKENLKIADIPINAKVHVGGTILNSKLTATKVIIQKEDAGEITGKETKRFEVQGTVKAVGADNLIITVSSANKQAKSFKGKDLTIVVNSSTVIEKDDATILIADIKLGDQVGVEGTVLNDVYTAAKIEVKVKEQAELKLKKGSETESEAESE